MKKSDQLAVIVHENNEVTVRDGRGETLSCKDCRFSGWLTKAEYSKNKFPTHCLHFSGGADPTDKDRIIHDDVSRWSKWDSLSDSLREREQKKYPKCIVKNAKGNCEDYVKAKEISAFNPLRWIGRTFRTLKMRK
jgi:hypothetical protein